MESKPSIKELLAIVEALVVDDDLLNDLEVSHEAEELLIKELQFVTMPP